MPGFHAMIGAPRCFAGTLGVRIAGPKWLSRREREWNGRWSRADLMDVLSEVLRVIRLSGVVHLRAEFTRPWAIAASQDNLAARLNLPSGSLIAFHVLVSGSCLVRTENLGPMRIETGDVIIFPRGDRHILASAPELAAVPMREIYPAPSTERVSVVKHGGGGESAHFICGFLYSDHKFSPLFGSLPTLLCVCARGDTLALETLDDAGRREHPIEHRHEADWWRASLRYLISEAAVPGPGNRAALARLAETLFVEALRWQLRCAQGHGGWLAGLQDPQVGRVLSLLHALPDRPWTVDELAREAAMSRAALAKRFVELVGQPPIQYLAGWRMNLARDLLRGGTLGIAEIAERVGYESEAAFNRAFRRVVGLPPATWREAKDSPARVHAGSPTSH
jgi:AraC-like DNA-binding protein